MIRVRVKLFAGLRRGRFEDKEFEFQSGAGIDDILCSLNLKREDASIVLINGRHSSYETEINDGDIIALFPATGGG